MSYSIKLVSLILCLGLFGMQTVEARFGGGVGVGRPGGVDDFNHRNFNDYHNQNIGNYRPGYGWGGDGVVVTNPVVINADTGCQSLQQCDAYGNCVQTTQCD